MTIQYTVSMLRPHSHLYDVTMDVDGIAEPTINVALPVWTPGSYMVRDYARHVQGFAALTGEQTLPWHKLDKTTWRITTGGSDHVRITYSVYAFELTVRTSHLDGSHGYFNPATICMYRPGYTAQPHLVRVVTPPGWQVTTGLERTLSADPTAFYAEDYDHLVDSPFECGTHQLLSFEVDGIPHEIALWGHGNEDPARIITDTHTIVETTRDLFGSLPYQRYVFIVQLADSRGGGLEHRNSVTNLVDRWTFQPQKAYERFLSLTSHEFFHVWNVKRLRAEPLGPFDYSCENYTRLLWAMEGVTSYYDNLLLERAGLLTPQRYLESVAEKILSLQSQPGRALQSLELSSFDAWIKLYRPDENSVNSSISYYLKGSLVAMLLDLEIRRHTNGTRSLDDVLRYLYEKYPINGSGIPEENGYLAAVEMVAGEASGAYRQFFARYIAGTDELDYERAFETVGLALDWGYSGSPEAPAWLGLKLKTESGRTKVSLVPSDCPAYAAGIYAGDELLALDGMRVDETRLDARLAERRPGDTVVLSLFRRDELLHVPVILAPAPFNRLEIVPTGEPTDQQQLLYRQWLHG